MRNAWPMYGRIIGTGTLLNLSTTDATPYTIPMNAHGALVQVHNDNAWWSTDPTQTPLPGSDRGFQMLPSSEPTWFAFDPGQTIYWIGEAAGVRVWIEPRQAYQLG